MNRSHPGRRARGHRGARPHARLPRLLSALVIATAVGTTLPGPTPLDAQYFGQNQVRYDRFDFRIQETDHFRIYHYPEAEEGLEDAARMAERWYERLARVLQFELRERVPLVLYADHPDFQQTNVIEGRIGEGTGGVTEGYRNRVIMPLTDVYADTDHVLGHELVHAFQFAMAGTRIGGGLGALFRLPLWVVEGMAEYLSIGRVHPLTEMWLRDAVLREELPTLRALTQDPQYFPYRWGHAFWANVAAHWGDPAVGALFREALGRGLQPAIRETLGVSPDTLMSQWHQDILAAYQDDVQDRTHPLELGSELLHRGTTGARMHLAPSVSPDGRRIAFISERDLFSFDLWIADAETGEVLRQVVRSEANPHFDALAFIHAGATWSPDGEQLAVIVFAEGENRIALVDAGSGRIQRRLTVEGAGGLNHVSWSPDGRRIATSGISEGSSDLFLVDLETGETERLTRRQHGDIQPAWSPDGSTLVFASDRRPDTDFDLLRYQEVGLSLVDVETGEIGTIPGLPQGKQINPVFSGDGESVYFVGDPDGVSDVYRIEVETGELFRVTRVATGVSGITERSQAISVAPGDGRLFFSVFYDGSQTIRTLDAEEARGVPVTPDEVNLADRGALPPRDQAREGFVMRYLAEPETGLTDVSWAPFEYDRGISLERVEPVTVGVGADRFGAMAFGQAIFIFTDMLGDRWLGAMLAAEGDVRDVGGQLLYQNRERRWTWGVGGGRQAFRRAQLVGVSRDGPDLLYDELFQRQSMWQAIGDIRYPFSRARRVEFALGATRISQEAWVDQWRVDGTTGVVRDVERIDLDQFDLTMDLFQGTAAMVHDNTSFAFTGPVRGTRWRLEVQPTTGSVDFVQGLADARQYRFFRPFTFAMRGLHVGRYGGGAEDDRLRPFFIGEPSLVRGYGAGDFRLDECSTPDDPADGQQFNCPEFDRMLGSRIGVANLELRAPFMGVEGYGLFEAFLFPIDVAAFVDAGFAWTQDTSPEFRFERDTPDRVPVMSAGLSSRIALGQGLAFEIFWAYPFQRPERGGHFGFQIAPAW